MRLRILLLGIVTLVTTTHAVAGPKGTVQVRAVTPGSIKIDGDFSDWPLSNYTTISQQPEYPGALNSESTDAFGDHLVWDVNRVAGFNGSLAEDWDPESPSEFGSSVYLGYDQQFLYVLAVFIDDELTGFRDESGLANFLNDGLEIFIDAKGDSLDPADEAAFPNFDTEEDAEIFEDITANPDDFQLTMGLNDFFDDAEQHLERAGTPDIIKQGYLDVRDSLDLTSVGGDDIAMKAYSDLGAAGARNPEVLANPNEAFTGYAVEWVVPFGLVDGFTPDHDMGFALFWRDVDDPDDPEPGFGGPIFWTDWTQNETVPSNADFGEGLFHTANWGSLTFLSGDPCDFDGDGTLDGDDLTLLLSAVHSGANDAAFDVNGDSLVNSGDIVQFVEQPDKLNTYIGDANLDGEFNSGDLVTVFTAGEYEDALVENSVWATGDWNGDAEFNSSDLVLAFQGGGYETGPRPAAAAVPEPTGLALGFMAIAMFAMCRLGYRRRD